MKESPSCWCGNQALANFSNEYLLCEKCQTLVSQIGFTPEKMTVQNDEKDFYGKNYWLSHQSNELGYPTITKRSRSDLSERCLHWLKTVLKYKLAPAKSLELGCAHGGFVAFLKHLGYDASGLEMSPAIAEFAKNAFDIPMYVGPAEEQDICPGSLDILIMMDVLEHLPSPVKTIQHCLTLLKSDGILIVQMPNYPVGETYSNMMKHNHPFLEQLQADEHLFLFSEQAVQHFFNKISQEPLYLHFEPAIFSQKDMYFIVSRQPLVANSQEAIHTFLNSSPNHRIIQALIDTGIERDNYVKLYCQADSDRIARLKTIERLKAKK